MKHHKKQNAETNQTCQQVHVNKAVCHDLCNYADNYYEDQNCKSTEAKPANSLMQKLRRVLHH